MASESKISRRAWLKRAAAVAVLPASAFAQPPGDAAFFKGKTITLITSTGVGGTYDTVARLFSRHMPRHIPGNPTMIVENMPGGGNVLATNYMYNIAPKDGTAIATIHSAMPLQQVLNSGGIRYDADKFNWLGSTGPQNEVILVWHTAGITSIAQAQEKQIVLGGTGAGAGIVLLPMVVNKLLGTKFKIVTGYRTSEDVNLGMERGEVQARAFSLGSITSQHPDWISAHKVAFLVQAGVRRDKVLAGRAALDRTRQDRRAAPDFQADLVLTGAGPALCGAARRARGPARDPARRVCRDNEGSGVPGGCRQNPLYHRADERR